MPYTTVVSTDVLAGNLGSWVIVDCRFDLQREGWGLDQYLEAHIPGAAYASLSHDLSATPARAGGRHPLPSIDAMAATFGRLGVDQSSQVVAYDQDAGMYAARLWWMLRYLGHDAAAVLDGGWAKWTAEGRPVRGGRESREAVGFRPSPRPDMQAGVREVEDASRTGDLLVDARAPERFEGRHETIDRMAGHIPGAVNHFFRGNLSADGTMLPAAELRARLGATLGSHRPDHTVMYCGSGVTACHNLLAMEHAGLPGARLYVGSWSEWSASPDRPIETGPARRRDSS